MSRDSVDSVRADHHEQMVKRTVPELGDDARYDRTLLFIPIIVRIVRVSDIR